jgi:hypothetical protein
MNDKNRQIIPDSDSVVRCLDPEMITALESRVTFTTTELIEQMKKPGHLTISKQKLEIIYESARHSGGLNLDRLYQKMPETVAHETAAIVNMLIEGKTCSLLQPDGKGWQKGKLKLCFEFIPEETEAVEPSSDLPTVERSPLDEIRKSITVESN